MRSETWRGYEQLYLFEREIHAGDSGAVRPAVLCSRGRRRRRCSAVGKRAYCFPISGLLQEGIYALLGTNYFSILYVLWNVLVLFFLQRLELRREKEFAGVWIS